LWIPGVSTNTIWVPSPWYTPRTRVRVVWGLLEMMLTFCPQIAFTNDDLPTFGLPTNVTNPLRTLST
jgi:hypothetical protein